MLAQSPETSVYGGMPQSAIATGVCGLCTPPDEMYAKLDSYLANIFNNLSPNASNPKLPSISDSNLQKFICYFVSRLGMISLSTNQAPLCVELTDGWLRQSDREHRRLSAINTTEPHELDNLFRDLLIGVTQFFRDPETFEVLKTQVIPLLFERASSQGVVRVLGECCSTGEEAYSLAILLHEYMESIHSGVKVKSLRPTSTHEPLASLGPGSTRIDCVQSHTRTAISLLYLRIGKSILSRSQDDCVDVGYLRTRCH